MKLRRSDLAVLGVVTVLGAFPIGFMTFDFMFPNMSTPSLSKNLLAAFLISILVAIPAGYLTRRVDMAMITVIMYVASGYLFGLVLYSAPYTIYSLHQILASFYYAMYFRFTIIMLFIYTLGGFMGAVFGQYVRASIGKQETRLKFATQKGD